MAVYSASAPRSVNCACGIRFLPTSRGTPGSSQTMRARTLLIGIVAFWMGSELVGNRCLPQPCSCLLPCRSRDGKVRLFCTHQALEEHSCSGSVVSAIALLDSGPLPPHAEEVATHPGWHILPSGLPVLTAHRCDELQALCGVLRIGLGWLCLSGKSHQLENSTPRGR